MFVSKYKNILLYFLLILLTNFQYAHTEEISIDNFFIGSNPTDIFYAIKSSSKSNDEIIDIFKKEFDEGKNRKDMQGANQVRGAWFASIYILTKDYNNKLATDLMNNIALFCEWKQYDIDEAIFLTQSRLMDLYSYEESKERRKMKTNKIIYENDKNKNISGKYESQFGELIINAIDDRWNSSKGLFYSVELNVAEDERTCEYQGQGYMGGNVLVVSDKNNTSAMGTIVLQGEKIFFTPNPEANKGCGRNVTLKWNGDKAK